MKLKYKIFDIHTHIFPEKVAEKAVSAIGDFYNKPMEREGTVDALLESGSKAGVDRYLVLPTATKVEQVESANSFIAEMQQLHPNFIGFGTLHPDLEDPEKEIEKIINLGLHGVKFHPEFQNFTLDEERMDPFFKALEGRLPVLTHMGDERLDSSHPRRLARLLDKYPRLTVIAAHMGGYSQWDDACKYLVGKDVYFDTSSTLFKLDAAKAVEMIRSHGADRILFGSDYPMWSYDEEIERFMALELTEEERRMILYDNAARLFNLQSI